MKWPLLATLILAGCSGADKFDTVLQDGSVNTTIMAHRSTLFGSEIDAVTVYRCDAKGCAKLYSGLASGNGVSPELIGSAAQLGAATLMPGTNLNIQGSGK